MSDPKTTPVPRMQAEGRNPGDDGETGAPDSAALHPGYGTIGELAEQVTKGTTPTTYGYKYVENGIPFIRVENITADGRIDFSDVLHIDEETNRFLSRSQLQTGDLLISIAGSIGRTAIVQAGDVPANTNQAVAIVRLKTDKISASYLRHFLASDEGQRGMLGDSVQLAQANLSLGQICLTKIRFPPVLEQRRITEILDTLDDAIQKTEQLIAKLKQIKQGLLHDLLTRGIDENGQLRDPIAHPEQFKDSVVGRIPEEWHIKRLGDLCRVRRGASPRPIDDPCWFADEGPGWIRISDVTKANRLLTETEQHLSTAGANKSVSVFPGQVIMSICATIGEPIILGMHACIHDGFVVFDRHERTIDTGVDPSDWTITGHR